MIYLKSTALVFAKAPLRRWYFLTLIKTLVLGCGVAMLLIFSGVWGLYQSLGGGWLAGLSSFLWALIVAYFSGKLAFTLLSVFSSLLAAESGLARAIRGIALVGHSVVSSKWRRAEFKSMLVNVLISVLVWPLLLFPILLPIGLVLMAWSSGREASMTARRLAGEFLGRTEASSSVHPSWAFYVGLAILPVLGALVPVLGWAGLPILKYAGVESLPPVKLNS